MADEREREEGKYKQTKIKDKDRDGEYSYTLYQQSRDAIILRATQPRALYNAYKLVGIDTVWEGWFVLSTSSEDF